MHTYYGTYRSIEQAFLTYVSGLQVGPQRPVLVLCPSGRLAEYLRRKLAQKNGLISNLFFVTFSDLIKQLDQENNLIKLPLLPNDNFHDYLLKNTLLEPNLNRYPMSRGFVSAVKSSLRDLADSLANVQILEEHIYTVTDPILAAEQAHWKWLIDVYRTYENKMDQVSGYRSYKRYFEDALAQVQSSNWLQRFHEIIVYGFYDLTGRQLELFQILQDHYPMSVFWVYTPVPAFLFGRKFFETNLARSAPKQLALSDSVVKTAAQAALDCLFTEKTTSSSVNISWIAAPNPKGELFFVAKEILRLHEEENIDFADIAVIARDLSAYQNELPEIFAQNAIALQTVITQKITSEPLGIFLLNLLSLLRRGFDREDLLSIVTSPYFKPQNTWRYLIVESLAKRDYNQWTDLINTSLKSYDPNFLVWLEEIKHQLTCLEKANDWAVLGQAVQNFLQTYTNTEIFSPSEQYIWQQVQTILQGFARYQASGLSAKEGEFVEELLIALQQSTVHYKYNTPQGVTVIDVSAARGLGFKIVFLLGMNEKIFPQVIREDPVLKDYYRRIFRDQLGFWMNQKMERFEEERLLFYSTVEAAQERLYISFLRADSEGKALIPSSYIAELARACGKDLQTIDLQTISNHFMQRLAQTDFTRWTRKELSLALAVQGATTEQYVQAGFEEKEIADLLDAARDIASLGDLNERDGIVKSGPAIFAAENQKGFSPSALQDLAHCPMKYFFAKGLGLREQEETRSRSELAPNLKGNAYHQVLMDYYQHLYQDGLTEQLFDSALAERLEQSLHKHYTQESYKRFGIYPVIWGLLLQDMQQQLTEFVLQDAQHLEGATPKIFETYFEKIYCPSRSLSIKVKGIIDRIDIDETHKTFRVLDYKSSRHGGKDLTVDMFKYIILQPFIYLILAQGQSCTEGLAADGASLLTIQKGYHRQELTQAGFEKIQDKAAQFFSFLMQLIMQGTLFIHPGEHCQYCPYASICRKDAFRSLLRARHARILQALEEATR